MRFAGRIGEAGAGGFDQPLRPGQPDRPGRLGGHFDRSSLDRSHADVRPCARSAIGLPIGPSTGPPRSLLAPARVNSSSSKRGERGRGKG